MKNVFFKFFIFVFIPVFIVITGLIIFIHSQKIQNHSNSIIEDFKEQGQIIENIIKPYLIHKEYSFIDSVAKNILFNTKTFTVILDDSSKLIYSSDDLEKKELYRLKMKVNEILEMSENKLSFEFQELQNGNAVYYKSITQDRKWLGSIFLVSYSTLKSDLQNQFINNILLGILLSLIVSVFIGITYSRKITNSLSKIVDASRKVASGDFDIQVELSNKDDFKMLAMSFNEMTEQIRSLFTQLSMQKDELNSVISTMQEGLLVINRNDEIVLSNDSMNRIFNKNSLVGYKYGHLIKKSRLWQLINRTRDKKKSNSCELQIGQDFYLCTADFMEFKDEVLLIFFNITEAKKLEIVKKDFIMNVSHELRTPLTSIKGFIETLMDEIDDKHKQYLNIINNNTKRLISIVEDLLTLSELENKETKLILSDVYLPDLIKNISIIFEQKLKEKNISLVHNFDKDIPLIQADAFRIEQMMINLIDNAIKYSQQGKIGLNLSKKDNFVFIEVKDSGFGIPKEHLSRIFERFYTVDKSHSRKSGGTGLGLSIVKHIVQSHNGEIMVESELGKGTSFKIKLPIVHNKEVSEENNIS